LHESVTTILIVDGDQDRLRSVASGVEAAGLKCITTHDPYDALVMLRDQQPDTIVVRAHRTMSFDSAAYQDVLHELGTHPWLATVEPTDAQAVKLALRHGASDCLLEPVSGEAIKDAILKVVRGARQRCQLQSMCRWDQLTSLPNHRSFLDRLEASRSQCRRENSTLTLLMVDVDRFAQCNEQHSPQFGDEVLCWLADLLRRSVRGQDVVARSHTDRFVVALPGAGEDDAQTVADRLREHMISTPIYEATGRVFETGVSVSIVESTAGFTETSHQLVQRGQLVLQHIKRQGGNRTSSWRAVAADRPSGQDIAQISEAGVLHWVARVREELRCACVESTQALVAAVEAKDPHMRAHSARVSAMVEELARRIQVPASLLPTLRVASLLHDVGKIGVPDRILTKNGKLDADEVELIRQHPTIALDILGRVSFLGQELPIILHHHERYDGGGYPMGLAGGRIPIGARVLAVADAMDAMFSGRTYKDPFSRECVRGEVAAGVGKQFDPLVAEAALTMIDEGVVPLPDTPGHGAPIEGVAPASVARSLAVATAPELRLLPHFEGTSALQAAN
jgi:diguanylate cyclase (GGDEF)-like protein